MKNYATTIQLRRSIRYVPRPRRRRSWPLWLIMGTGVAVTIAGLTYAVLGV